MTRKQQQKQRRAKLIAALRSGEYKQTQGKLRNGDKFCCLGVACDLYRKATGKGKWLYNDFYIANHTDDMIMPSEVVDYFGFANSQADWSDTDAPGLWGLSLTERNDAGRTFKQIARTIEQEPKGMVQ